MVNENCWLINDDINLLAKISSSSDTPNSFTNSLCFIVGHKNKQANCPLLRGPSRVAASSSSTLSKKQEQRLTSYWLSLRAKFNNETKKASTGRKIKPNFVYRSQVTHQPLNAHVQKQQPHSNQSCGVACLGDQKRAALASASIVA